MTPIQKIELGQERKEVTVGELIEALQKLDKDCPIAISCGTYITDFSKTIREFHEVTSPTITIYDDNCQYYISNDEDQDIMLQYELEER